MQIREPKFKLGERVIDKDGNVITVIKFNSYHFDENEYWYDVSYDGEKRIKAESFLEPYIEKSETEKKKSVWDLKEGEECYSLTICGNVHHGFWDGSSSSIAIRELGELFLTKEEAEFEVERRKIETEMIRLGGRRKFKEGENNWYIFYDFYTGHVDSDYDVYDNYGQGAIYFDSFNKVDDAIKEIGKNRIIKYIFGVES